VAGRSAGLETTKKRPAEDDDAAEEEQVDDDEGYETVVGDDEEEEVSEEEVTLDEKQQVLYDEFMDKIKDYDVQNLYAIAHRNGIKGAELDAEFKTKETRPRNACDHQQHVP